MEEGIKESFTIQKVWVWICIVGGCIILMTIFRASINTTLQPPEEKQLISFPTISSYVYGFASTNNPAYPRSFTKNKEFENVSRS